MEKERFQFCSEEVERESESGIAQVHRERVPHGRRGVVETSWAQCLGLQSIKTLKLVAYGGILVYNVY